MRASLKTALIYALRAGLCVGFVLNFYLCTVRYRETRDHRADFLASYRTGLRPYDAARFSKDRTASQLLVAYVSPSLLTDASPMKSPDDAHAALGETPWQIMTQRRPLTEGERWEKFEAEYGIRRNNPSWIMGVIESAKYSLDKAVFATKDFTENIENALEFDSSVHGSGRGSKSSGALVGAIGTARLQTDVDLEWQRAGVYVGVKLVIPFGN